MAAPVPETVFNPLLHELTGAIREGTPLGELELRRLKHQIAKLENHDYAGAHELYGHAAAAAGDIDGIHSHYAIALARSSRFVGTVVRYIVVLALSAETERVLEIFTKYRDALRGDFKAYDAVQKALHYSGWVITSSEVRAELESKGHRTSGPENNDEAVNLGDFDERKIASPVGFALRYLRSRHVCAIGAKSFGTRLPDGKDGVLFELKIPRDVETVAELEWDLFGAIGEAGLLGDPPRRYVLALTQGAFVSADHAS